MNKHIDAIEQALEEARMTFQEQEYVSLVVLIDEALTHLTAIREANEWQDDEILSNALEAGFMISTQYGQDTNQPMPVSDSKTLLKFARSLLPQPPASKED